MAENRQHPLFRPFSLGTRANPPLFRDRTDPSFIELTEATRNLQRSPPPYFSRSLTPVERGSDEQQDDAAFLQALEETARRLPMKWAANIYAGMSEEQRLFAIQRGKEIDRQIAKEREERILADAKFFSKPTEARLFTEPRILSFDSWTPTEPPNQSVAPCRKRKVMQESDIEPEAQGLSIEVVQDPAGRPRKRARFASSDTSAADPITQRHPVSTHGEKKKEEEQEAKKEQASKSLVSQTHRVARPARKKKRSSSAETRQNQAMPRSKGTKMHAAAHERCPNSHPSPRRSERIAQRAARRLQG
jgi:hypothetical protein